MTLIPRSYTSPGISIYADTHYEYEYPKTIDLNPENLWDLNHHFNITENGENYNLSTEQVANILRQHFRTQRLAETNQAVKSAKDELDMIVRLVDGTVSSEESTG